MCVGFCLFVLFSHKQKVIGTYYLFVCLLLFYAYLTTQSTHFISSYIIVKNGYKEEEETWRSLWRFAKKPSQTGVSPASDGQYTTGLHFVHGFQLKG